MDVAARYVTIPFLSSSIAATVGTCRTGAGLNSTRNTGKRPKLGLPSQMLKSMLAKAALFLTLSLPLSSQSPHDAGPVGPLAYQRDSAGARPQQFDSARLEATDFYRPNRTDRRNHQWKKR